MVGRGRAGHGRRKEPAVSTLVPHVGDRWGDTGGGGSVGEGSGLSLDILIDVGVKITGSRINTR